MPQKTRLRHNNRRKNQRLKRRKTDRQRKKPEKIQLRRRLLDGQNRHPPEHDTRIPDSRNASKILDLEPINQNMVTNQN
ncbi:hypothetical protein HanXRQr2_Chr15g0677391 [Helianthus annuus]|uniref:Uncharacterized protein n=1 Tax=Helianthus annuus TaxID=4232 RepID=A0A9K3DY65_HELAN|nr:hypothetical protein HanXRQr2_Chr15g0677391 [Helianthus annuus]KAJ0829933.1 hypothetical protein HanPSC8_Chr15g0649441 [Helianthus annuus]